MVYRTHGISIIQPDQDDPGKYYIDFFSYSSELDGPYRDGPDRDGPDRDGPDRDSSDRDGPLEMFLIRWTQ